MTFHELRAAAYLVSPFSLKVINRLNSFELSYILKNYTYRGRL